MTTTNIHTHSRARRPWRLPAALLAIGLLVVACGSDGSSGDTADTTSTTPPASSEPGSGDPILDFYQCLRDNGLDVADPQPGDTIGISGVDTEDPEVQAVIADCSETHLGNTDGRVTVGEGAFGDNMASPESLLAFVDCIREHGIDMPDPTADGRLPLPEGFDTANRGGPEFQQAAQTCAQHLDGGIRIGSPGEGGGVTRQSQP